MLNVLILGTEATSYIFNNQVNPYFDDRYFNVEKNSEQQITKIDLTSYKNQKIDVVIFDVIIDTINSEINDLKYKLEKFVFNLRDQFPNSLIVYNQTRYAKKTLIDNNWDFGNEHPIDSFLSNYSSYAWDRNKKLEIIDEFLIDKFELKYIRYDENCSGLEYRSNRTRKIFTYNESYYLQKMMSFYQIMNSTLLPSISTVEFPNDKVNFDNDIILVNNLLLEDLIKNKDTYDYINKFLMHNFVLDGRFGRTVRFIKRKCFYRKEFSKIFDVYHITEMPSDNKLNSGISKIVFYFCGLDWRFNTNGRELYAPTYLHRDLLRSLVPDTLVVRIADVNLFWGSWYHNTYNYPDYEKNIANLINYYQNLYNVSSERSILFGVSRGGHAALYYSKMLDLPAVAVAPPIDLIKFRNGKKWYDYYDNWWNDRIFNEFVEEKNQYSPKVIIDDESIKSTFEPLKVINDSTTHLFNLGREKPISHGKVAGLSVPLQYSLVNGLLMGYINNNSLHDFDKI